MRRSLKWVLFAALVTVPTVGFLVTKLRSHPQCPTTAGQPCDHVHVPVTCRNVDVDGRI
jgi:hypothetical protein